MNFTIYTVGDPETMTAALRAVAMFFGVDDWVASIVKLGFILALLLILGGAVVQKGLRLDMILIQLLIFYVAFMPKATLVVEHFTHDHPTHVVDNVPYGIAVPAAISSAFSLYLTNTAETVFSTVRNNYRSIISPADNLGPVGPAQILMNTTMCGLNPLNCVSNNFAMTVSNAVQYCRGNSAQMQAWAAIPTSANAVQAFIDGLNHSSGLTVGYNNESPFNPTDTNSGVPLECGPELVTFINSSFVGPFETGEWGPLAGQALNRIMAGVPVRFASSAGQNYDDATKADLILQASGYLHPKDMDSSGLFMQGYMNFFTVAALASATRGRTPIGEARRMQHYDSLLFLAEKVSRDADISSTMAVPMMDLLFFVFLATAPMVMFVALVNPSNGLKVLGGYFLFGMWTQSWIPMYAIANFWMQTEVMRLDLSADYLSAEGMVQWLLAVLRAVTAAGHLMTLAPMVTFVLLSGSMYAMARVFQGVSAEIGGAGGAGGGGRGSDDKQTSSHADARGAAYGMPEPQLQANLATAAAQQGAGSLTGVTTAPSSESIRMAAPGSFSLGANASSALKAAVSANYELAEANAQTLAQSVRTAAGTEAGTTVTRNASSGESTVSKLEAGSGVGITAQSNEQDSRSGGYNQTTEAGVRAGAEVGTPGAMNAVSPLTGKLGFDATDREQASYRTETSKTEALSDQESARLTELENYNKEFNLGLSADQMRRAVTSDTWSQDMQQQLQATQKATQAWQRSQELMNGTAGSLDQVMGGADFVARSGQMLRNDGMAGANQAQLREEMTARVHGAFAATGNPEAAAEFQRQYDANYQRLNASNPRMAAPEKAAAAAWRALGGMSADGNLGATVALAKLGEQAGLLTHGTSSTMASIAQQHAKATDGFNPDHSGFGKTALNEPQRAQLDAVPGAVGDGAARINSEAGTVRDDALVIRGNVGGQVLGADQGIREGHQQNVDLVREQSGASGVDPGLVYGQNQQFVGTGVGVLPQGAQNVFTNALHSTTGDALGTAWGQASGGNPADRSSSGVIEIRGAGATESGGDAPERPTPPPAR